MKKQFLVFLILSFVTRAYALQPRLQPQSAEQAFLNRLEVYESIPESYTNDQRRAIRQEWETVRSRFNQEEQIRINTRVRRLAINAAQILGN